MTFFAVYWFCTFDIIFIIILAISSTANIGNVGRGRSSIVRVAAVVNEGLFQKKKHPRKISTNSEKEPKAANQ